MAGGRKKPRLRDVGVFRRTFCGGKFGIEQGQLFGAIAHTLFERRIGALQRLRRLEGGRHIGEGYDQSAIRHPIGADLDDQMTIQQPFEIGHAFGGIGRKPHVEHRFGRVELRRGAQAEKFKNLS